MTAVTQLLAQIQAGDSAAADQLLPPVDDELRLRAAEQPEVLNNFYVRIAMISFFKQWDRVDPNGHADQAREQLRKFVDYYYRREAASSATKKQRP